MSWKYIDGQLAWVRFTNTMRPKRQSYQWLPGTHFDFLTNRGNILVSKITVPA